MKIKNVFYVLFFWCLLFSGICCAATITDPLADSVKPEVAALFGAGSTVAYCIYTRRD